MTAALIANRYWSGFRALTLPLKAFAVTSIGTFSLIIGADRASRAYEDHQFDRDLDGRWNDQNLEHQLGLDEQDHQHHPKRLNLSESLSSRDKLLQLLKEKKYEIVLGSWAASMVGSFGLVAAQPMPFTQKLIQARMYAFFSSTPIHPRSFWVFISHHSLPQVCSKFDGGDDPSFSWIGEHG